MTVSDRTPLVRAASRGDDAEVQALLAGTIDDANRDAALWHACASDAPSEARVAIAARLLDAGASPRRAHEGGTTPLHQAARLGPVQLVELLIRHGALNWQTDAAGRTALDHAREGSAVDRDAITRLLDRPVIRDARFKRAVELIHAGDVAALERLLDAHPHLLRDRAVEPDCYPRDYFRDPRLFWFIADNPNLMKSIPPTIGEIAKAMIARGVEQADLDYALELVMTSAPAREQGHQLPLLDLLLDAGATVTSKALLATVAHRELAPIEALLTRGLPMSAPVAAALGRDIELPSLLASASPEDRQTALDMAVVNRRLGATRLCLAAGADATAFLPVHAHSTALHEAVLHDDVELVAVLVEAGARLDVRDKLWDGTPLGWAVHTGKARAEAYLRARLAAG